MSGDSRGAPAHDHVYLGAGHDENARRTRRVVALTAVAMAGEIAAGLAFGSMALLADGLHMATHAGALGVAALAYAYASRHARSDRYSFGTGKVGDLAAFASALLLGVVALGIGAESVGRLVEPRPVSFGPALLVAVLGLAVNLASAALLAGGNGLGHGHGHGHGHSHHDHDHDDHHHHGHGHGHGGRHGHDNNLRSAYAHVLADALTSVLAILALLGGLYLDWVWLDPAMGLAGAAVIAVWAVGLMRDSAAVLLDASERRLAGEVRLRLEGARIADLHVWRIGPGARAAIVSVAGLDAAAVRARLADLHIAHLTVETA